MSRAAAVADQPINKAQTKIIHTLKGKLGLSDSDYRERLGRMGVKSSKELTFEQAKRFIKRLKRDEAKCSGKAYAGSSGGSGHISRAQMDKIRAMWAEISYLEDPDAREAGLYALVKKLYHVEFLSWLSHSEVSKLIKTLEVMKAQKADKETLQAAQEALSGALAASETAETAPAAASA